jgi:ABC-type multidrug transport system fused ATPase/permease subunit
MADPSAVRRRDAPHENSRREAVADRPQVSEWQTVRETLSSGGMHLPGAIILALMGAALGTVIEALLLRGVLDVGRYLPSTATRLGAMAALLLFLVILLSLDWPAALGMYRMGRRLELLLRSRFLLQATQSCAGNRSRSLADLAFRAHWLFSPRQLIETLGFSCYLLANIVFTGVAIIWVYPNSFVLATVAVMGAGCLPAFFFPGMARLDLQYREYSAALSSTYWDALKGVQVIRAQGIEQRVRTAYLGQLQQWANMGLRLQAVFMRAESMQLAIACLCTIGLVYRQAAIEHSPAGLLLLVYWSMSIPVLGREFAAQVRSLPALRSTLFRFQELMQPPEQPQSAPTTGPYPKKRSVGSPTIEFSEVCIHADGSDILNRVSLRIGAGEHIAIVGSSGAGKSTLLACLLGWRRPSSGTLSVDGAPLDAARLASLRGETAWIDPQVHLFAASALDNIRYGNEQASSAEIADALETVDLRATCDSLPQGLQTPIGDQGGHLASGECQRLRIGRALARSAVRLVILDEPMRGFSREQRRRMMAAIRRRFANATLLCATHDISDTLEFDRVLVMERGAIVEQGCPPLLAAANSRYRGLCEEERAVSREFRTWRHVHLHAGSIHEGAAADEVRFGAGGVKQA